MNHERFDAVVRSFAGGFSRRKVLAGAALSASGWLLAEADRAAGAQPDARSVRIETDEAGLMVAAQAGAAVMSIAHECGDDRCSATVTFAGEAAGSPLLDVLTKVSADNAVEFRFVGDIIDVAMSLDPSSGVVDLTVAGQPPARGSFDPASGRVTGIDAAFDLPPELAAALRPLTPALSALAGEAMLMRPFQICPWGSPGPTFPEDVAPAARKGGVCRFLCGAAGVGLAVGCCLGGNNCAGCITAGGGFASGCSASCPKAEAEGNAGAAPAGSAASATGATPTPSNLPADTAGTPDDGAGSSPATPPSGDVETPAPVPTATATPTPGPPACAENELPCADRCIPVAECPPEDCCLDAATCQCACPDCGANAVFDPTTCGCTCASRECQPGWFFDEATCSCVCPPSPCAPGSNWQFDQETCSCICIPPVCPDNWVADETACTCVCVPFACPPNFAFEPVSCSCFCPEAACAEGEVFDAAVCVCIGAGAGAAVGEEG